MFCYKCGQELPDDSEFCYQCGAVQPKKDNASNSISAPAASETNVPTQQLNAVPDNNSAPTQQPNTAPANNAATPQPYQQPYSNSMAAPVKKKSSKTPIIIAVAAVVAVAAIIAVLFIFVFNSDNKDGKPQTNTNSSTINNAATDINDITTEEVDDISNDYDEVEAQEGHYTVKDLAQYFECTSEEITELLGEPTDVSLFSQVNLRYFFGDDLIFLWVGTEGAPLSQITVSANILERNGEALDKTAEELIALLGVPKNEKYIYDEGGQISGHTMEYLLNKNVYTSFSFGSDSEKASTVNLTLYNDKLPLDMEYIKDMFEYSQEDITNTFGSPIYFYFNSGSFANVFSYNVFTAYIDTDSGLMNSIEVLASSIAFNGQTLDKSSSEIISILGTPADKGDYSDDYHKYFMQYILDDKWELTLLMKDANSDAHMVSVKPYQEDAFENDVPLSYSTRDGYNSTLTLDPYGGFELSVNRMSYFSDFAGTYQKTENGYKFEVAVGRNELQEFEMEAQGKNLVYCSENIGATFNGTVYYLDRTLDEIKYNGQSVYQALNVSDIVLTGEFNSSQLTVDGTQLNITRDEIMRTFGAMRSENSNQATGEYTLTYWITKSYTTFEVTFYFEDYSGNAKKVKISELYMP